MARAGAAPGRHTVRLETLILAVCFRDHEVTTMIETAGASVIEMSASGWAAHNDPEHLAYLQADPVLWQRFLDMEKHSCATPGAVDGGPNILFVAAVAASGRGYGRDAGAGVRVPWPA